MHRKRSKGTNMKASSKEYAEWVASVWRLNAKRNNKLKAVDAISILGKHDGILPDDLCDILKE